MKRNVGRRIAEVRRGLGLTQEDLAQELGVGTKYLQRIERGTQNLSIETLVKIVNVLGVRSIDLYRPAKPRVVKKGRPAAPSKARSGRQRR